MAIERISITLPPGFDPARHRASLERLIAEKHGAGFEIDSIDPQRLTATATRQAAITEVTESDSRESFEVRLARGTKPSDGDRLATRLADQHEGYVMTSFEPFLGKATLSRMSERAIRCRGALALALGVKPWEVGVGEVDGGGFSVSLPPSYMPSKHDDKLTEVAAAVVGRPGWYVETDAEKLVATIVPGDPPTFPATVRYPFGRPKSSWESIPIGVSLGRTGDEVGPEVRTSFVAAPHMQVSGISGGGKGVTIMCVLAGAIARGWEVAVVDAIKGGVDFVGFRPFVRPGGWGEDLRSACCVLNMAYDEGLRRKNLIKSSGVQKWTQLPPATAVKPILVVVDELTSLISPEPSPKGVAKDHPLVVEVADRNLLKATILSTMGKIARELRFAGVSLLASSQVASTTSGVPTELRTNLGAKILLGAKPTDNNRRLALSAPDAVPSVPPNIAADPAGASRGVGVYELEGVGSGVYKGYWAEPAEYGAWLAEIGAPTTDRPHPTPDEIARHTPSIDAEQAPAGRSAKRSSPPPEDWEIDPATGERLRGFERANAARHQATVVARQHDRPPAPTGRPDGLES